MKIQTINPATEQKLEIYDYMDTDTIAEHIEAGHHAFLSWKTTSFSKRQGLMLQLSHLLELNKDELGLLISQEMGKPITAAKAEIEKCAWLCEYFALNAESYLKPKIIQTEMKTTKVCYNPLGVVFAIMPWNFPFWQVFRFAVPNIMAGNAAILKHAPISTGTGNKIAELFQIAGFPQYLFQHFIINDDAAAKVIEHPLTVGVTITGSERAGRAVAAHAGKCLKKTVLELGGNDPYIVLEDADLDLAAHCIVTSRLSNTGQVCISAKRIIVVESIYKEFITKIKHYMGLFKMGDPLDPTINIGPLARSDLRDTLNKQVQKTLKQGAKLLCGGIIPDGVGFYYPPTLLTEVKPGMTAFEEELFGPVVSVTSVADEAEAISCANLSRYGLGAAVFTKDLAKGERIATEEIESGVCFVNAFVATDPRVPFGGIKNSGYGRELSKEGILEFVNIKTVAVSES